METITINKEIIFDLAKQISELNDKMETLELMSNPKLMASLERSKEQIFPALISEEVLAEAWDTPEEDEIWKDL